MDIKKAAVIADNLIDYHGLTQWLFRFDGAVVRFGLCDRKKCTIFISKALTELNSEEKVIDVILHEIAHALSPARTGHGYKWRVLARSIGCNGLRCYGRETISPIRPYIGTCPGCSTTIKRHNRKKIACARCCRGRFDPQFLFTWKKSKEVSVQQILTEVK